MRIQEGLYMERIRSNEDERDKVEERLINYGNTKKQKHLIQYANKDLQNQLNNPFRPTINKTSREIAEKNKQNRINETNFLINGKKRKSNFNNERIYQNDEGQIEENDNYERVDDFDEEDDDKINQQRQSQRFKIETYEPIEVGNKNENDEIIKDYKKNENLFLEPRDSTKLKLIMIY